MSGRHDGRVAVVTGGAKGIGRAYALRLAGEGATVAVLDTLTIDDWCSIFAVNVDTMFHATRAFLPGMKEHGWAGL